jgi:rubrerythrin
MRGTISKAVDRLRKAAERRLRMDPAPLSLRDAQEFVRKSKLPCETEIHQEVNRWIARIVWRACPSCGTEHQKKSCPGCMSAGSGDTTG